MKKSGIMSGICISIVLVLLVLPVGSHSQIPTTISYQGYLTDTSGNALDGSVSITFSLYNVATGGSALWFQTQTVLVNQGVYSVVLGGGSTPKPVALPFDEQYWLGVKVDTDNEMIPRQALTSVPYALNARSIIAYDNNNQFLGIAFNESATVRIYDPSLNQFIRLSITTGDVFQDAALFFTTADCTNTPYYHPRATYEYIKNGNTYYIGENVAPVIMQINSQLSTSGQCSPVTRTDFFVPLISITPPYSLPVALPFRFQMQ